MSKLAKWKGKTALITGASSGIGMEMARFLALAGCHLILVARREERLKKLADEIAAQYDIRADILVEDLSSANSPDRLVGRIEDLGRAVDLLINNAGVGPAGDFAASTWQRQEGMLQLNMMTLAALTHKLLPAMIKRGRGDILMVSSAVAYSPMPGFAAYCASKSFVTAFGQALGSELKGSGVNVTVVHPGGTKSEFWDKAGYNLSTLTSISLMSPQKVALIGLKAMANGRRSIITGFFNSLAFWFMKWIPLSIRLWAAKNGMKMIGDLKDQKS